MPLFNECLIKHTLFGIRLMPTSSKSWTLPFGFHKAKWTYIFHCRWRDVTELLNSEWPKSKRNMHLPFQINIVRISHSHISPMYNNRQWQRWHYSLVFHKGWWLGNTFRRERKLGQLWTRLYSLGKTWKMSHWRYDASVWQWKMLSFVRTRTL